jgi:hypothetical protein
MPNCYTCGNICQTKNPVYIKKEDTEELVGYRCRYCDPEKIKQYKELRDKHNKEYYHTEQGKKNIIKAVTKYKKNRFGYGDRSS